MRTIVEIIMAKRRGEELSDTEIRWLVNEYASDQLPDYQMSAMAMAVFFQGLNARETGTWTDAMMRSGRVLDFAEMAPARVDKHSTGGVGDKISLPLGPAAAACGVFVPMVSGRGLGHTGGTADKLEAIPGYRTDLSIERFREIVADVGCSIISQTGDIAPADKRLYALRDVTATVESIPLICASIMSKKMAEGLDGLVLDVKVGGGAFMKTVEQARDLAAQMVAVGAAMNKRVVAFLTRMEEPLGQMVGNACEVRESMDVLDGQGPPDVEELVVTLGGAMVELATGVGPEVGRERIATALHDGSARARFERMVSAQGGDLSRLPRWEGETTIVAPRSGWVCDIDGLEVGLTGVMLGAGRVRRDQEIDPVVGIRVDARRGCYVSAGEPLATILHGKAGAPGNEVTSRLLGAFSLGDVAPEPVSLIIERIG